MKTTKLLLSALVSGAWRSVGLPSPKRSTTKKTSIVLTFRPQFKKPRQSEAKGGKIVRWEKEHGKYEAVVEKGGKEWGVVIDDKGKVLSKHDESKEKH